MSTLRKRNIKRNIEYLSMLSTLWNKHLDGGKSATMLSFFSGGGGSSLGLSAAGFKILSMTEIEKYQCSVYSVNFPSTIINNIDIAKLTPEKLHKIVGTKDVSGIEGSPPCQPFSSANRSLNRMDGERPYMYKHLAKFIRYFKPKFFWAENVKTMRQTPDVYNDAFDTYRNCGYRVRAFVLLASNFGVPQARQRLFFIGYRNDINKWPTPPLATVPRVYSVRDAIGDLGDDQIANMAHIWQYEGHRVDKGPTKTYYAAMKARQGEKYALTARRDVWSKPAATVVCNKITKKPYLRRLNCHPLYTRTYSCRELMRLMSFPDQYKMIDPWDTASKIAGNSVPPLMSRAIGAHIKKELNL